MSGPDEHQLFLEAFPKAFRLVLTSYERCCCSSSSVTPSCLILCDPMDCSTPVFPVLHHLLELTQTHIHSVSDAIQPSRPLLPPYPPAFNLFPASGSFPMSQLFASGGQSIGVSASASIPPVNTQAWFPLGWTKRLCCVLSRI